MVQEFFVKAGLGMLLFVLAVPAAAQSSRTYELSGFDGIAVTGAYTIDVEVGGRYSVRVSGPSERLADARVRVENGRLVLGEAECRHCRRQGSLRARVTLPALRALEIAGVAEDSRISGIAADEFSVDVSGVAELELSGRCDRLSLDVNGVGHIQGENLRCGDAVADLDGVGEADIYASGALDADVDGMAHLTVHGSPQRVSKQIGGFGHIEVR